VTSGYRKVPGDICTAGLQLAPSVYQCSNTGYLSALFSVRGLFVLGVFAAVIYFGWPIIEAILITLPLPDPKHVKESIIGWLTKAKSMFSGVMPPKQKERQGYLQDFE
jgi:hypothetical protein